MPARILTSTPENLELAAAALRRGDVVGIPTETVYGLAGLAFDERALARVFAAKDRPTFDPLIVHVARDVSSSSYSRFDWLEFLSESNLVAPERFGPLAVERVRLLTTLWPGPLTLVLPKQPNMPDLATSGLDTVAIRAPRHAIAQALLRAVGQPLVAPSANRFGRISPTSARDVQAELGDRIELILDGGPCDIGLESTVVHVAESGQVTLLRPGAVTSDALQGLIGARVQSPAAGNLATTTPAQRSPGMLASHYAPIKPLYLLPAPLAGMSGEQVSRLQSMLGHRTGVGVVLYTGSPADALTGLPACFWSTSETQPVARVLTSKGDAAEAAFNLFRTLRELDAHPQVQVILVEPVPDESGLGHAIADRLRRASSSK